MDHYSFNYCALVHLINMELCKEPSVPLICNVLRLLGIKGHYLLNRGVFQLSTEVRILGVNLFRRVFGFFDFEAQEALAEKDVF